MGGLVGGIFDLVSGDPTSGEQKSLESLSSFQNPLGEKNTQEASDFYGDILSGDPAKIAQVLAPEIKAGQDQVNQAALTNSQFGNRGGGTNSSTQHAQGAERGNIINLIGGLQQGAASAAGNLGMNLMEQGSGNLMNQAGLAAENQKRKTADVSGIASSVASMAMPFLGGAGAAGGLDPASFGDLMQGGKVASGALNTSLAEPDYSLDMIG
jgi:hypothetical protein